MGFMDNIPEISFIENTKLEDVISRMINNFQERYKEITNKEYELAKANPYRLLIYSAALEIYQALQYIDTAGKMNFYKYAYGNFLDNLVSIASVSRQQATPATTILQFSIASAIASPVPIPAGCRVTNGNEVYFATDEYVEIPAGQTSVSVTATCTEAGTIGNGFSPGEFNVVVNTLPYIVTVTNTTDTTGGANKETDDALKERAYEAPHGFSVAGPEGAYVFFTKSVSPEIGDVIVSTPDPSEVDVCFIMADGSTPNAAMIQKVEDYLQDNQIRPVSDLVSVSAPTASTYNVNITYYIPASSRSAVTTIQNQVAAAVSAYNEWQTAKIGRDINPSYLIQKVMEAGAKRVTVTSPTYTVLNESTIAKTGTVTVTYGGVEDD